MLQLPFQNETITFEITTAGAGRGCCCVCHSVIKVCGKVARKQDIFSNNGQKVFKMQQDACVVILRIVLQYFK